MIDKSWTLPRRTVRFRSVSVLLLVPPLALLVWPQSGRTIFAVTMIWLLIAVPVAVVALTDWSHRTVGQRAHLATIAARVPARLLALAAVFLGIGFPLRVVLQPTWRPSQSLAGAVAFGLMMVVLGQGLWQSTMSPRPGRSRRSGSQAWK